MKRRCRNNLAYMFRIKYEVTRKNNNELFKQFNPLEASQNQ